MLNFWLPRSMCPNCMLSPPRTMGSIQSQQHPRSRSRDHSATAAKPNEGNIICVPPHPENERHRYCFACHFFHLERMPVLIYYPQPEMHPAPYICCSESQARHRATPLPLHTFQEPYVNGLNQAIILLTKIRDLGFSSAAVQIEDESLNPWLDACISYLRSIAYHHGIRVDFNSNRISCAFSYHRCRSGQ